MAQFRAIFAADSTSYLHAGDRYLSRNLTVKVVIRLSEVSAL
jgi:hypothetical protein